MSQSQRQERLRRLVKELNRRRKQQAKQVDILCNDLIAAHRSFLDRLDGVGFAAAFYKALLGAGSLRVLLSRAARLIEQELPGARVAFFLRQNGDCELYEFDGRDRARLTDFHVKGCLGAEAAESICKSNRRCTVDDMVSMGLEGDLKVLNDVSMVTLPLSDLGRALGFILLYRPMPHRLAEDELNKVGLITCGLAHAMCGYGMPVHFSP